MLSDIEGRTISKREANIIRWKWIFSSIVLTMIISRFAATTLVPCDRKIDNFVPFHPALITKGFEGYILQSESLVLFGGLHDEPLKFLRMTDFHKVFELRGSPWCVFLATTKNETRLLIGEGSSILFLTLPDMKLSLKIDLEDLAFRPAKIPALESFKRPRLFLNNDWLVIQGNARGYPQEWTAEVMGWRRSVLNVISDENPPPDFHEVLKISAGNESQTTLYLDPVDPLLTLATENHGFQINLETGQSREIASANYVPSQQLGFNAPRQRRTNLAHTNWYVEAGTERVRLIPDAMERCEIEHLNYSIRCEKSEGCRFEGLVLFRNSLFPSPSLLYWTVLFPCYYWLLFSIFEKFMFQYFPPFIRLQVFGLGILAVATFLFVTIGLTSVVLTSGGFWLNGLIAWVVPPLILLPMSVLNRGVFNRMSKLILFSVGIALPMAVLAWWVSFSLVMPPLAITSHVIATTAILFAYLSMTEEKLRSIQYPIPKYSIGSRLSRTLMIVVICIQVAAASMVLLSYRLEFDPERNLASGFFASILRELAFYAVLLSSLVWIIAWCLQATVGHFHKTLVVCTFISLIPFLVAAYQLKLVDLFYASFEGYWW